jgi:NAD(P)H-flavin reductase
MSTGLNRNSDGSGTSEYDTQYAKEFPDIYICDRPRIVQEAVTYMSDQHMDNEFALIKKLLS